MAAAASSIQSRRWPAPLAEIDAVALVLVLEPRAAQAQIARPSEMWSSVVAQLGHQARVAECVGTDQQPQPDPGGAFAHAASDIALEDRLLRLAEDRVQVVPRPQVLVAQLVDLFGRALERRPVGAWLQSRTPNLKSVMAEA